MIRHSVERVDGRTVARLMTGDEQELRARAEAETKLEERKLLVASLQAQVGTAADKDRNNEVVSKTLKKSLKEVEAKAERQAKDLTAANRTIAELVTKARAQHLRMTQQAAAMKALRSARAVDAKRFSPTHRDPALREAWGAAAHAPVAIHVGRIAAEKNLGLAVRAFRRLQGAQPLARFVFVGDGPERERLARENPDFLFAGVQRGEALARHFASAANILPWSSMNTARSWGS